MFIPVLSIGEPTELLIATSSPCPFHRQRVRVCEADRIVRLRPLAVENETADLLMLWVNMLLDLRDIVSMRLRDLKSIL